MRDWSESELVELSNREADRVGVPRRALLGLLYAESNLQQYSERWGDWRERTWRPAVESRDVGKLAEILEDAWPDVSFGPGQQIVLYAPVGNHTRAAENVLQVREWLFDPLNAIPTAADNFRGHFRPGEADGDFRACCRYNWPAGGGSPASPAAERNYRRGLDLADSALQRIGGGSIAVLVAHFDSSGDMPGQSTDWTCSSAAAAWALRSIGIPISEQELTAKLGAGILDDENGLLDGSGTALAAALGAMVQRTRALGWVTFDQVMALAGRAPVLLGGVNWGSAGHWVAVRGVASPDSLELANSALGYGGISQVMSRAQWERVAPVAGIILGENFLEVHPGPTELEELRARNLELSSAVGGLTTGLAHLVDVVMQPLNTDKIGASRRRDILREGIRIREQMVGPYPGVRPE